MKKEKKYLYVDFVINIYKNKKKKCIRGNQSNSNKKVNKRYRNKDIKQKRKINKNNISKIQLIMLSINQKNHHINRNNIIREKKKKNKNNISKIQLIMLSTSQRNHYFQVP
jgi:hypothetical protein